MDLSCNVNSRNTGSQQKPPILYALFVLAWNELASIHHRSAVAPNSVVVVSTYHTYEVVDTSGASAWYIVYADG